MNEKNKEHDDDDMRPEYDFSGGVRGKYANALRAGYKVIIHHADGSTEEQIHPGEQGVVILDPDVRKFFPDSESVNRALRFLIDLIPKKRKSA